MLEELFYTVCRIRRVEEQIARVYPSDKIKSPIHLSIGQEAISAGVCRALSQEDAVFGTYRSHALYLAKGGDLKKMIAELYGKSTGCCKGKGGSMHLADVSAGVMGSSAIVATAIPHAVGFAFGLKYQKKSSLAVTFFGDGATEEGAFYESLNLAALKKLPVLFICENNGYAVHSKISARQARTNIAEKAAAFGVPASSHKGINPLEVFRIADKAVCAIKSGMGPQLLEFHAYRWHEHVGPNQDFDSGYRNINEAAIWFEEDPLKIAAQGLSQEIIDRTENEVQREIEEAFRFAEESPLPEPSELFTDTVSGAVQ